MNNVKKIESMDLESIVNLMGDLYLQHIESVVKQKNIIDNSTLSLLLRSIFESETIRFSMRLAHKLDEMQIDEDDIVYLGREGFFDDTKPVLKEEEFKSLKSNDQFNHMKE